MKKIRTSKRKVSKKPRALVVFSGGLDSILAVKILQEQGINVTALTFVSYFFDAESAKNSAGEAGVKLIAKDFSDIHLKIVEKPKHGYGKVMNPCIDCHALMFKEAWKIAEEKGFDVLASGEVLGQRPLSQVKPALARVEKEADLKGKILRPLSAKLLPETIYEERGIVDREKLESISGRGRKKQMALAKKLGIKNYPTPSGGCRLTESGFSEKLKKLLENRKEPNKSDFELLKLGRHFWFDNFCIVVGRNEEDNEKINDFSRKGDIIVVRKNNKPGPTVLVRKYNSNYKFDERATEEARKLLFKFSKSRAKDWKDLEWEKGKNTSSQKKVAKNK